MKKLGTFLLIISAAHISCSTTSELELNPTITGLCSMLPPLDIEEFLNRHTVRSLRDLTIKACQHNMIRIDKKQQIVDQLVVMLAIYSQHLGKSAANYSDIYLLAQLYQTSVLTPANLPYLVAALQNTIVRKNDPDTLALPTETQETIHQVRNALLYDLAKQLPPIAQRQDINKELCKLAQESLDVYKQTYAILERQIGTPNYIRDIEDGIYPFGLEADTKHKQTLMKDLLTMIAPARATKKRKTSSTLCSLQ